MKTSFLKSFFNSKDICPKNNFNIHAIDLDESDDLPIDSENFISNNSSNFSVKKDENDFKRRFSNFALNDNNSNTTMCMKSPRLSKNLDFSKFKKSPLNSPAPHNIRNTSKLTATCMSTLKMNLKGNTNNISPNTNEKSNFKICSPMRCEKNSFKMANFKRNESNISPIEDKILDISPKSSSNVKNFRSPPTFDSNNMSNNFHEFYNENCDPSINNDKIITSMTNNKLNSDLVIKDNSDNNNPLFSKENNTNSFKSSEEPDNTKLKALHMKLKNEAEKILKWKENMEKDLKLKTVKIDEYDKIIDSLRNSNLDLQMRQETISMNYQDEIETRSDVLKKVENSRHLCQAIKEKIDSLEKVFERNEIEKENFTIHQSKLGNILNYLIKNLSQVGDIQNKVKNKILEQNECIKSLKLELKTSEENNLVIINKNEKNNKHHEEELISLNNCIAEIKSNNSSLCQDKIMLEEKLCKEQLLKDDLVVNNNELLETNKDLEMKINSIQETNNQLKMEIESTNKNIELVNDQYIKRENELLEIISTFEKKSAQCNNLISEKNVIIEKLETNLKEKEIHEIEIEEKYSLLEEELNSKLSLKNESIDNLTSSIVEKENENINLNIKITNLENYVLSSNQQLENIQNEKDSLVSEISILKSSNNDLREELTEKNKDVENLSLQISEIKNSLQNSELENKTLTNDLLKTIESETKLKTDNENNMKELKSYKQRITETENDLKYLRESLDNLTISKDDELIVKENIIVRLSNEVESLKTSNEICTSKFSLKETEINNLSIDLKNKIDLLKVMENEFECLQTDLKGKCEEIEQLNINIEEQTIELNFNCQSIKSYSEKLTETEKKLYEKISKVESLQNFINELSNDKQSILKSREDLRKELMFTLEQCKNENEINEKKKNKEIENLRKSLEMVNNENQSYSKKTKSKLQEALLDLAEKNSEISELNKNIKNQNENKNLMMSEVNQMKMTLDTLHNKVLNSEKKYFDLESEKCNLESKIRHNTSYIDELVKNIECKDSEISRLKVLELEYNEIKQSPPCTQIPDYIKLNSSSTPKAQKLSTRLSSLEANNNKTPQKTPQKTPKGILRQPGSASKRRKVFFENTTIDDKINLSDIESSISDGFDIDLENINKHKKLTKPNNINVAITPKKQTVAAKLGLTDTRNSGRLSNIRKTPSKTTVKLTTTEEKNKENWFDNDNFFGVGVEA